jgi:membrane protein implicated in regulation of membrane protease activity
MTWALFYLACFLIGVSLSVLSFLGGSLHLPHLHLHVPHGGAHMQVPHAGGAAHAGGGENTAMPFVNFGTIMAFLAWFGGSGYLLTRYSSWVIALVLVVATVFGLVGATVVFWFVAKFLLAHSRELDPADYDRVGVLARVTSPIREGGTGEITFSMEGTRQACGARSENGEAIPRATEVIVTRYERGIAYVRKYEDLAGDTVEGG